MRAMLKHEFLVVFVDRKRFVSPLTILMHFTVADRAALGFCVASHAFVSRVGDCLQEVED